MRLEQAIEKPPTRSTFARREAHRQLAGRQLRLLQRQVEDPAPDLLRDAVPDATRPGRTVAQSLRPTRLVEIVPAIERGSRDAEQLQRLADRQRGLLDQADDLGLFGGGILMPRLPHPRSCLWNGPPLWSSSIRLAG